MRHSLVAHRFGSLGFVVGLEVVHRHLDRVLLEFLENHPKTDCEHFGRHLSKYTDKKNVSKFFTFPGLPGNPGGPKFMTSFITLMLKKGYKCKPGGPDG